MPTSATMTIRIATDTKRKLERLAADTRRSKSFLAAEAVSAYVERELAIIRARLPGVEERLSRQIVAFVQELRRRDLFKLPGVAETLDWTRALTTLDTLELAPSLINDTLGTLLKYQDDIVKMQGSEAAKILAEVNMRLSAGPAG